MGLYSVSLGLAAIKHERRAESSTSHPEGHDVTASTRQSRRAAGRQSDVINRGRSDAGHTVKASTSPRRCSIVNTRVSATRVRAEVAGGEHLGTAARHVHEGH